MSGQPFVLVPKPFEQRVREAVAGDAPKHELIALLMEAIEDRQSPRYYPNWMFDKVAEPRQVTDISMCNACRNGGVCGCYRPERDSTTC